MQLSSAIARSLLTTTQANTCQNRMDMEQIIPRPVSESKRTNHERCMHEILGSSIAPLPRNKCIRDQPLSQGTAGKR